LFLRSPPNIARVKYRETKTTIKNKNEILLKKVLAKPKISRQKEKGVWGK